jgi:hypothetical protein
MAAFIWRGMLGGVIGFVLLLVLVCFNYWLHQGNGSSVSIMFLQALVLALAAGVIQGGLIGIIIWWLTGRISRGLGFFERFLIGIGCALVASHNIVARLLTGNEANAMPFTSRMIYLLAFAILGGGLAGIMARPTNNDA